MPGQLALPFGSRPALGREDFIVAPCNEQALRFIERWPDWPVRAAAIWGPRDSGKTHLARIFCDLSGASLLSAPELSVIDDSELPPDGAIAVELDESPADSERDRRLFALFERPSGTLFLTGRTPPPEWKTALGDLRSRFDALLAFPVWAPDDDLLSALIRKQFSDRQLDASENVVRRLLTHVERTPQAVAAFIARIDDKALAEKRAIGERLVMELIDSEAARRGA
jgi:chromosomal replication initiation ATPase DnaA